MMSEQILNPYAAPAPIRVAKRPRFRDLFRGIVADLRWNDSRAMLRTGLRLLLVAMSVSWLLSRFTEINWLMSVYSDSSIAMAIGGPTGVSLWRLISQSWLVHSILNLLALVLLCRGTPVASRRLGTACLVICGLITVAGFASSLGGYSWLVLGAWGLPWIIAGFVFIALRQVWLRRLAITDSTKQMAGVSLSIHCLLLVRRLGGMLIFMWRPQLLPSGPSWLSIVSLLFEAGFFCFDMWIVARVLGENISAAEKPDEATFATQPAAI